ncbi:MAG: HIT domain-containing protein [Propionibacteriales bacterium]|nr:HIT domain-containing protein [Propionibacteriales bacterium]
MTEAGDDRPGPRPESEPELVPQDGVGVADRLIRLWTPHRMAYIKEEAEAGRRDGEDCPFCRIPSLDDVTGLILARGETTYAVLNLHPYNPGHLMVLPYRHVGTLDGLTDEELLELTTMTRDAVRAVEKASSPHGFNIGLNLGGVAGGSLSEHLHQHVVPRWGGDANFITVLARTKVIPQLLSETRALLAESWPD